MDAFPVASLFEVKLRLGFDGSRDRTGFYSGPAIFFDGLLERQDFSISRLFDKNRIKCAERSLGVSHEVLIKCTDDAIRTTRFLSGDAARLSAAVVISCGVSQGSGLTTAHLRDFYQRLIRKIGFVS